MSLLELYYNNLDELLGRYDLASYIDRENEVLGKKVAAIGRFQKWTEFKLKHRRITDVFTERELREGYLLGDKEGLPKGTKVTKVLNKLDLLTPEVSEDLLSLRSETWIVSDAASFLGMSNLSSYTSCMSLTASFPRREAIMEYIGSPMVLAIQLDQDAYKSARQMVWLDSEKAVIFPLYGGAGAKKTLLGLETWLHEQRYFRFIPPDRIATHSHYWLDQPLFGWSKEKLDRADLDLSAQCPLCGEYLYDELCEYHVSACPACAGYVQCEACGEWVENLEETYDGYNICYDCMDYRTTEVRVLYP